MWRSPRCRSTTLGLASLDDGLGCVALATWSPGVPYQTSWLVDSHAVLCKPVLLQSSGGEQSVATSPPHSKGGFCSDLLLVSTLAQLNSSFRQFGDSRRLGAPRSQRSSEALCPSRSSWRCSAVLAPWNTGALQRFSSSASTVFSVLMKC